jgi:hypothetical protein
MGASNLINMYAYHLEAYALVDGVKMPLTSFEVDYQLNAIPQAIIQIAVGRDALTNKESKANDLLAKLKPFTAVDILAKVTLSGDGLKSPPGTNLGFPAGEFIIFQGYVRVPSSKVSASGVATITVICQGVMAGLAAGTQFVQSMTTVQTYNSGYPQAISLGDDGEISHFVQDVFSTLDFQADIWNNGIQFIIKAMVERSTPRYDEDEERFAAFAFKRFESERVTSHRIMPLGSFNGGSQFPSMLNRALATAISDILYTTWKSSNLFGSMMYLSQIFHFYYVPLATEDHMMPVCPQLNAAPHKIIGTDEYWEIEQDESLDGGTENPFSGELAYVTTCALHAPNFQASPWQGDAKSARSIGIFSYNQGGNSNLLGKGRLLLLPAPSWVIPPGANGRVSLNAGDGVPDATTPQEGKPPPFDQSSEETAYLESGLGDALASTILHEVMFAGRRMRLWGRFRADIAPGSLVKIMTVGDKFSKSTAPLYGCVNKVTLVMDGKSNTAFTVLYLTHIRCEEEQQAYTASDHPLYGTVFNGCPLVEGA